MTEFDPTYETIGGLKMRLTEICHDRGMAARTTGYKGKSGEEAYLAGYYDTLRKLVPDHPALADMAS